MVPVLARRHAAVRARPSSPTGRTPTPSCGVTIRRNRRPTASTPLPPQRGESLAAAVRRADLQRMGIREGAGDPRGGPAGLRGDGPLRRGRRLDRLAAVRHLRPQRVHARATRASGRTAGTRRAEFLAEVQPRLRRLRHREARPPDRPARRPRRFAHRRRPPSGPGLPEGIPVAVGNVDAHVTVAAADALDTGQLVAIMGTSTCHVMNSDVLRDVPGMCGVVDGGILEGSWGYEAGQSGVGDIFAWFVENCVPGALPRRGPPAAACRCTST